MLPRSMSSTNQPNSEQQSQPIGESRLGEVARDQLAQLQLGIDVANVGLGKVDYSSGIFELTEQAAQIYGLGDQPVTCTRDELHATFHPEDRVWLMRDISAFLSPEGTGRMSCQHQIVHEGGEVRWVEVRKQVFFVRTGDQIRPTHGILAARDITDQKDIESRLVQAKKQAEAASQSKSAFLANMSHEIRTPMTAILGYTDLALEQVSEPDTVSNLKTIKRNGIFLLDIINDILDLSKIEAGKLEVQREPFEPVRLIHDVVSIMNVRAIEKGLQLSFDIDSRIPRTIQSDPKRLKQILVNLVGNAIKFTELGCVRIQAQCDLSDQPRQRKLLAVSVSDTGLGLATDEIERLFEPFVQGDSGITRDFGGTGLGLAISQRLASMLGGRVECESEKGVGSTFTCFVDIGQANHTPIPPTPHSEDAQIDADERAIQLDATVLIVDDRRDIRFLTSRLLTRVGAAVEEASDGIEAMEKVQSSASRGGSFDLIVLDMQMPRLDGYQVARRLRQSGFDKPIIALTAEAMDGDAQRCLDCGCDAYASKPIDARQFVSLVHKHLRRIR